MGNPNSGRWRKGHREKFCKRGHGPYPKRRRNGNCIECEQLKLVPAVLVLCFVCGLNRASAKGRCRICYNYWRRHGKDRGAQLIERQKDRLYRRMGR